MGILKVQDNITALSINAFHSKQARNIHAIAVCHFNNRLTKRPSDCWLVVHIFTVSKSLASLNRIPKYQKHFDVISSFYNTVRFDGEGKLSFC